MSYLHQAIYALNPSVITIRQETAYDKDENVVEYDMAAAQSKAEKLESTKQESDQAAVEAKQTAIAKLTALGLTADEIAALGVK